MAGILIEGPILCDPRVSTCLSEPIAKTTELQESSIIMIVMLLVGIILLQRRGCRCIIYRQKHFFVNRKISPIQLNHPYDAIAVTLVMGVYREA